MSDSDTTKPAKKADTTKPAKKATKKPAKKAAKKATKTTERAPRAAAKKTGKAQVETPPPSDLAVDVLGAAIVDTDDRPILTGMSTVRLVGEFDEARTPEDAIDYFIEMINQVGLRRLVYAVVDEETGETYALRGDRQGEIVVGSEKS